MHTLRTAMLSDNWDLMLETDGTLKMCSTDIESLLQNCCNEIRLWLHDAYFRYEDGIDYNQILAHKYNETRLISVIRQAIMNVDSDITIKDIEIYDIDTQVRKVTGLISIEYRGEYGQREF